MQDLQYLDVIFKNKDTKETKHFKLDHSFFESTDQLRVILGGEEYKLLSTKSPEQLRIEKAIVSFGEREFLKLAKQYPEYGSSSKHLTLPSDIERKIMNLLELPRYKTLRRAVNKDSKVMNNILRTFAYFISTTRTVDALVNESKARRLDDVYLIDYTKRNQKFVQLIMNRLDPVTKNDLKTVYEQISKDVDIDDRRPLGVEHLLNAMSPLTTVLENYKTISTDMDPDTKLYSNSDDPAVMQYWNELYTAALTTNDNLESLLEGCYSRSNMFSEMEEDKLHYHTRKILDLHKEIVSKHNESFQQVLQHPENKNELQEKFVVSLKKYISDVSTWGYDFVCDRRPLDTFFVKMLELQYDTVFFYLEQRTSNESWIFNLMETVSTHIKYLEKALAGELPIQKSSAQ